MIAMHVTVIMNLLGYTLTAAGHPGHSLAQNLARTVLTVAADLILIPLTGFVGPAYATLIGYYATQPVCIWLLRKSDISPAIRPYAVQTALLWLCAGLFWWTQPATVLPRLAILGLFAALNAALRTVSLDDARLVLPQAIIRRLRISKEAPADGH
jgi:O-antigen/teichoic acid export membrane protein